VINYTPPGTEGARPTFSPESLMPRRNPGLIRRIAAAIFNQNPETGPQDTDRNTTGTGIVSEGLVSLYDRQFKFDVTRRATYKDVEEIDQASEEASVALDTIANNVCTSEDGVQMSIEVTSEDSDVQKVLDTTINNCKLHHRLPSIVRNLVKYGDSFNEIVVNDNLEIVNLKPLPPITMFRNENLMGQLLLGEPKYDSKSGKVKNGSEECAFEQKTEATGQLIATFWPWQILHVRLNHDGFSPYGRSHLRVARVTYKKLKAIEEGLIVGRLTREYQKLVFYLDTTGLSKKEAEMALTEFQQNIMQRKHVDGSRENPFSVMTDFFITTGWIKLGQNMAQARQTKIDIIDPKNAGIHDITDVEYLHRKFLAALRVPPAHLGFEKDVNSKSTLTIQDVQYVRMLRTFQQEVGKGLEQLFDCALILAGIDPATAEYEITWPALAGQDIVNEAQAELFHAQTDQVYSLIDVIDPVWVQMHRLNMTNEEIEEISQRIEQIKARKQQEAMQQAQQQNQMQVQRQTELIKAKAQVGGFAKKTPKENLGRVNKHDIGEDDAPGGPSPNRDVAQAVENARFLARLVAFDAENILAEDVKRAHEALNGLRN
jgi:capsid assembly protein Gp20